LQEQPSDWWLDSEGPGLPGGGNLNNLVAEDSLSLSYSPESSATDARNKGSGALNLSVMKMLSIPRQHLSLITGKDRKHLDQLEQVYGVSIMLRPPKDGDDSQEICIAGSPIDSDGPSKCTEAANEIEKLLELYTLLGQT